MLDEFAKVSVPTWIEKGYSQTGRAAVILLQGISGGSQGWTPQIEWLSAQGRRTLAWDMPGYGHSAMQTDYSFAGLADALLRMLDAASIERRSWSGTAWAVWWHFRRGHNFHSASVR